MKYIVVQFKQGTPDGASETVREFPIIFPEGLTHKNVAEFIEYAIRTETVKNKTMNGGQYAHDFKIVSAGFLDSERLRVFVRGKSESLNVSSRREDDELISGMDRRRCLPL